MRKITIIGTTANSILGFRKDLILSLIQQGYSVYALAIDYTQKQKNSVIALGATPVSYKMSRTGLNPFKDLISLFSLIKIIRSIKPDIVLSYFAKPVIYGSIASKVAGVPQRFGMLEGLGYYFTDRGIPSSKKERLIRSIQILLYKLSLPLLSGMILLNEDDKKDLLDRYNIHPKNLLILGGIGINIQEYTPTPAPIDPINFLFIGRLLREKGIYEFAKAASIIKKESPHVTFTVLGGTDYENPGGLSRKELQQLIKQGIIEYPGFVKDVRPYIEKSSLFILPSYREGMPRSTQEAMAMGRGVITTDVPGCRDTVLHNETGLIIPPHNAEALANSMRHIIKNPQYIQLFGIKARKFATLHFDAQKANQTLINFLKTCSS